MTASLIRRVTLIGLLACVVPSPFPAVAAALDRPGYLAIADRLQAHLGPYFNETLGRYDPGRGGTTAEVNADLLLVHAAAALQGHDGPSRDDRKARLVARFLVGPDAWTEAPLPDHAVARGLHGPAWRASPDHYDVHMVFVTEVAEALAIAYRARAELGLDDDTVARIRDELARVAGSSDWRWPALRLNQFNWYVALFAADAAVNGTSSVLADGMRRHLAGFLASGTGTATAAGNLGAGLGLHYLPARPPGGPANFGSSEYANIVLGFSRYYGQARRAGMPPPLMKHLLLGWVRRTIAGEWTHAGYLNWDTGLGFARWHMRKKVPLAQQALLGIAAEPELQPTPVWGRWAKWLLDRGLRLYVERTERELRLPAGLAYGVHVVAQSPGTAVLAAARTAANAMRALDAGLDVAAASEPPALYAFDPDTGRLAVTTPAYNTAIVADNHRAFPYGGLDIARLYDSHQEVAASIGGRSPASFGLRVRAAGGRVVLRTQYGTPHAAHLALTSAPSGVGASTHAHAAYAGAFRELRVRGDVRSPRRVARTEYRFTPRAIDAHWAFRGERGDTADVTFPSWGSQARITAQLRDGRTVTISARPRALGDIVSLHVASAASGYRATPLIRPAGATVRLVRTRPQNSAPDPGPTLEVVLPRGRRGFGARLVVD